MTSCNARPKNDGYVVTIYSPMHCVIVIVRVSAGDNRLDVETDWPGIPGTVGT
jgi:hypothetical protein